MSSTNIMLYKNELIKIAELAADLYPLDMHWLPKGANVSGGGQGSSSGASGKTKLWVSDLFVLATSDGKDE